MSTEQQQINQQINTERNNSEKLADLRSGISELLVRLENDEIDLEKFKSRLFEVDPSLGHTYANKSLNSDSNLSYRHTPEYADLDSSEKAKKESQNVANRLGEPVTFGFDAEQRRWTYHLSSDRKNNASLQDGYQIKPRPRRTITIVHGNNDYSRAIGEELLKHSQQKYPGFEHGLTVGPTNNVVCSIGLKGNHNPQATKIEDDLLRQWDTIQKHTIREEPAPKRRAPGM